ncbi:dermonecrotic toxin domain-containing protein [Pseudomonas sp. PSKL.D1]|uniref:dermonecrotic toxin domain-containing protein n=1 Tax=Pseudomonas sp. PSKL.D1 TaxID=3029060 RepID=UPI00238131B3|nr:DUF6543 domain-containing protein [Pseudomonas sp. PSKL.D1]WDY57685.1 hypothetical protein PVV54_24475 [Pseudomonas sp. PSKL.D1]
MLPLEQLEQIDQQIHALLRGMTFAEGATSVTRAQLHGDLASFWSTANSDGVTPKQQLQTLRSAQLTAEVRLRLNDQTLTPEHAALLSHCLALPLAPQRRHLPMAERPQLYRVLLEGHSPNWRSYLPGAFVIIAGLDEARMLSSQDPTGAALLCCMSQGIEAFDSLADLHQELSERLEDPLQSRPLLHLYAQTEQAERARQAERLRYDWFADSLVEAQVECCIEAQRQRLSEPAVWNSEPASLHQKITKALALGPDIDCQALLKTRYSQLLEKNLPNWLRNTPTQGLSHIMQTMQELVAAAELAAAPGILDITAFKKKHDLLSWAKLQLRKRLRQDLALDCDPEHILVSVVLARQTGAFVHPFATSPLVASLGLRRVGDSMIEMVKITQSLDQLALHNLPWFDFDYWLTAKVTHENAIALPAGLTPEYLKALVRDLDVGGNYNQYLQTQLITSRAGKWRLQAHVRINRAKMRADLAKARYAGHFADDPFEHGFHWASAVLDQPHNGLRPPVAGYTVTARQLKIMGHTLQGVLLLNTTTYKSQACVLYTPDAPDRRAWRRFRNTRELLRAIRKTPALCEYVVERLPLLPATEVRHLLQKGRLGPNLKTPEISDDLFYACYMAEARALIAQANAGSKSTWEVDAQSIVNLSWRIVDFVSLMLPSSTLMTLSIGRMAIDIWDGVQAYKQDDVEGIMRHAYEALSHANDAAVIYIGSGLLRRSLRSMPKQPPLPLPKRYEVQPDRAHLRYRIDGIYGEGVYEQVSPFGGLSQYFVKDNDDRHYKVSFNGERWSAIDPEQPDAYLQQPLKRKADGQWVIDSPVLWYDGLPDLVQLLNDCYLSEPLTGTVLDAEKGLYQADDNQLYLSLKRGQVSIRRHLLSGRYHLPIPEASTAGVVPWAVLNWERNAWRIRVRQAGRSSDWLTLPDSPLK